MKLTKSELKQIIEEELLKEELNPRTEGYQSLYDSWQPETDEGMKYKAELGKVIKSRGRGGPRRKRRRHVPSRATLMPGDK
jgi:hypothetical protein